MKRLQSSVKLLQKVWGWLRKVQCLLPAGPSHWILSIRFYQNRSISGNKAWCSRWLIRLLHSLFFQNNLNLLRDIAVLIARDFKSKPVQSQLFVLHRYGEFRDRGKKPWYYVISDSCIALTPTQAYNNYCLKVKHSLWMNINKVNKILNRLGLLEGCVMEEMCKLFSHWIPLIL